MWIIGVIIFVLNGLGYLFALNLIFKENKYKYIIHSILFFAISITGIYLYLVHYLVEALITFFILGGVTSLSEESILPTVIKSNNHILTYSLLGSSVLSCIIFLFL